MKQGKSMEEIFFPVGPDESGFRLPENVDILRMPHPPTLTNPSQSVLDAIARPIESETLNAVVKGKDRSPAELSACIVISDSTRPVPYKGEAGILWPLVDILLNEGLVPGNILVLVATGTHRGHTEEELRSMLDPRVFDAGIRIENHVCHNNDNLTFLG